MATNCFCRLCALKSDNYVDVFDGEGEKLNLACKIKKCLQIWVFAEDILPKTICLDCCNKLDEFTDFFNLCAQSQVSLMEMFNVERKGGSNDHDGEEVKPPLYSGVEDVIEFDGEEHHDSSEYNIESVLTGKTHLGGTSKRKLRPPIKHALTAEELQVGKDNTVQKQFRRTRAQKASSFKEESSDPDDDNIFDDESPSINKGTLEGYTWECTNCDQELPTLSALKAHHQDVHNQPPNFKCSQCKKVYTRYRSFARHIKLHGNPKKYSCEICGKRFSQKTVLQSHSTVHSEERPHVCTQCGKAFKQFSSLYLHSKCHLPDQVKPKFPCSVCSKEFSTKHTLETHMKIHTGERNYVCDICGKSFIAKGSLDYHMLTHNDDKPHSCPVCGKGFKTSRLLTKHSTLHTGIKPHQCDVCGKQFRERGALKEHNRIHTGAMPYSCEFCGKLFRFKGILTVHRRQHTGERPYSCSECNREFTNWANYNKHMKRRHRNNEQPVQRINRQPSVLVQSEPITPTINVQQIHQATSYDNESVYKIADDHEVYRVPSYVPSSLQMGTMNYYIPPIHTGVLQRNQ